MKILVIVNAGASPSPAFTDAECDAVRDWVKAGGALLLIADHAPFGERAEILARRFGVDMGKGYAFDASARARARRASHHRPRRRDRAPDARPEDLRGADAAKRHQGVRGQEEGASRERPPRRRARPGDRHAVRQGQGRAAFAEAAMFSAQIARFPYEGKELAAGPR